VVFIEFIDLSHTITNKTPVYPGDESISLKQNKFVKEDQYNNFILKTGLHVGTHIDTPMHMLEEKSTIDTYPLEKFCGNAVLINAYQEDIITYKDEYKDLVKENDIVLIYTGHSQFYHHDNYYKNYPTLTVELVLFLIQRKVKMIGLDSPSPDVYPFLFHHLFFKQQIMIIENLTNLNELVNINAFEIYAFPLKITADASLVRVVAKVKS